MKKKQTAQIREELRKEMSKTFEKKYAFIVDDLERYRNLYKDEIAWRLKRDKEIADLKEENAKLKDKLIQYEDWIHRLQEFMDIKDDEKRKKAFETYIEEKQSTIELNSLMNVYNEMFNRLFTF